jgi:hypothetical protein
VVADDVYDLAGQEERRVRGQRDLRVARMHEAARFLVLTHQLRRLNGCRGNGDVIVVVAMATAADDAAGDDLPLRVSRKPNNIRKLVDIR